MLDVAGLLPRHMARVSLRRLDQGLQARATDLDQSVGVDSHRQRPALAPERLSSRGYTNAEKALARNYMAGDVVGFHRSYKRLGVEKGDELRVAGVDHAAGTVRLPTESSATGPQSWVGLSDTAAVLVPPLRLRQRAAHDCLRLRPHRRPLTRRGGSPSPASPAPIPRTLMQQAWPSRPPGAALGLTPNASVMHFLSVPAIT